MNTLHNHVPLASDGDLTTMFSENPGFQWPHDPLLQDAEAFESYVWRAVAPLPESDRRAVAFFVERMTKSGYTPTTASEADDGIRKVVAMVRELQHQSAVELFAG